MHLKIYIVQPKMPRPNILIINRFENNSHYHDTLLINKQKFSLIELRTIFR